MLRAERLVSPTMISQTHGEGGAYSCSNASPAPSWSPRHWLQRDPWEVLLGWNVIITTVTLSQCLEISPSREL